MPQFAPVRVHSGWYALHRLVRNRRRALALGLAVTAAALVAAGPGHDGPAHGHPGGSPHARAQHSSSDPVRRRPTAGAMVSAPVRIADAETVRLLRPGDRVDVIAADIAAEPPPGGEAQVVARGARVTKVPEPLEPAVGGGDGGALVVLSVPRATAARLAGASTTARLAVTLW
ncbi:MULTISPECIES: RcpC/CpaB family pilus assembly protein [Streptomyces]|uniref:RcpC/CpaB family pilus assembly protein n=2 Tax=Streptomyces TaxID=1883 RepID=A0ABV9IK46_9ACTN